MTPQTDRELLEQAACVIKAFLVADEDKTIEDLNFVYDAKVIFEDIKKHLSS